MWLGSASDEEVIPAAPPYEPQDSLKTATSRSDVEQDPGEEIGRRVSEFGDLRR